MYDERMKEQEGNFVRHKEMHDNVGQVSNTGKGKRAPKRKTKKLKEFVGVE